jgi:flagellar FliL protein
MSDEKTEETKPKKKGKGLLVKLIGALVLVGAGGGGVYAMVQSGMLGEHGEAKPKEKDEPKLIRKGEEDPYAPPAAEGAKEGEGAAEVEGEGGSEYRTVYYSFAEDFTSNLRDSDSLVQMSVAASTRRDGRVIMWIRKHELAIRSELLAVLADTAEEDVTTIAGKENLQKRLTAAINQVLTETEGFGGVDAVHFKSLIVQ